MFLKTKALFSCALVLGLIALHLSIPLYAFADEGIKQEPAWWITLVVNFLPLGILIGLWLIFMRRAALPAQRRRSEEYMARATLHMERVEKLLERIASDRDPKS